MHSLKRNQSGFDHIMMMVAFVVAFGTLGALLTVVDHAAPWDGALQLGLSKTLCMDNLNNATASGTPIELKTCNNNPEQNWTINEINTTSFTLKAAAANVCAYDNGDSVGTTKRPVYLETYTCNTKSHNQLWEWAGSGSHELENVYSHGCISDPTSSLTSGTKLAIYSCSNATNEQWLEATQTTTGGSSTTSGGSSTTSGGSSTSGGTTTGCTSGGVAAPCIGSTTTGASGWGTPSFDSEFNGSSVNTSQWTVEGPVAPNNTQEYDCYAPQNVSESGGYLNLALTANKCTIGSTSWPDTGAQMDTSSHFNQTYGYYEARVNYPGTGSTVDNWGAFWLTNNNWPNDGEIDVGEDFHGSVGYHFEYAPKGTAIWQGGQASGNWTGWHTYGVNWQPKSITYYYDGKEVGSYTTGVSDDNQPMFLILDYSTGPQNNVGGPSVVPDTMQVQYVKAWK
jgi:beta-glucanase (GH16 family)